MRRARIAVVIAAALPHLALAAGFTLPGDPQAGEEFVVTGVHCQGSSPTTFLGATTAVSAGALEITAAFDEGDFSVPSCSRFNAVVGGLAAGTYRASYRSAPQRPFQDLGTLAVSPATIASPRYGRLNGNWFDPAEPGWGVNIVQGSSGALFAAWMAYAYDGSTSGPPRPNPPIWLVMSQGRWISPETFRGVAYRTVAPDPRRGESAIRVLAAGYVTLTFESPDRVRFEGVRAPEGGLPLVTLSRTLRRFIF